jgi:hypothetical protein
MFTLQDEYGMLPDGASDKYVNMLAAKPPIQGFALAYVLDEVGFDALSLAQAEKIYEPMCKWANYWTTFRDPDGDGLVSYMHGDESGWDDSSIFAKGMPVSTPDIAAFLILVMEGCGKLAQRLGLTAESETWLKKSKTMLDSMIATYWNGQKFICRMNGTGEIVDEESIAVYQPIILGKRLPPEIAEKIAKTVGDPAKFFMPAGFASESQLSPYYDVTNGPFMLGTILAPVQLMMTVGLYMAGQKEVALKNAFNWCEACLEVGPQTIMRSPPQKNPPKPVAKPVLPPFKEGYKPFPGGYSSWGAAVFLVLGSLLSGHEGEVEK